MQRINVSFWFCFCILLLLFLVFQISFLCFDLKPLLGSIVVWCLLHTNSTVLCNKEGISSYCLWYLDFFLKSEKVVFLVVFLVWYNLVFSICQLECVWKLFVWRFLPCTKTNWTTSSISCESSIQFCYRRYNCAKTSSCWNQSDCRGSTQ